MKTSVTIQNLKCGGCESTIAKKLNSLEGIHNISVNLDDCTISFRYETDDRLETVQKELTRLDYPLEGTKNTVGNRTKSYLSCAISRINR